MRVRGLFVLIVAAALGCGRASAPAEGTSASEHAPAAASSALRFDWAPPLRARVTEVFDKKGHKGKLRYDIVVAKAEAPAALRVTSEGFRFEEIDGPGAGTPEVSAALAAIGATMKLPTLLLDDRGEVIEVVGLEQTWEQAITSLEKSGKMSPTKVASIRKLLEAPEMRASLKSQAGDAWMAWVGLWRDMPRAGAGAREGQVTVTMADGSEVKAPIRYEEPVSSSLAGGQGLVRVSATSVLEGAAAREAMSRTVKRLAEVAGGAADSGLDFRREMQAEADTDPRTMRPQRARLSLRMTVSNASGKRTERTETSEYTFEWLPAGQ